MSWKIQRGRYQATPIKDIVRLAAPAAMAILAGMVSTGTLDEETGAPVLEDSYGITAVVMLFVFNSFFGIGYVDNNRCKQNLCHETVC